MVSELPLAHITLPIHHHSVGLVTHLEAGSVEPYREPLTIGSGDGDGGLLGVGVQLHLDAGLTGVHTDLAYELVSTLTTLNSVVEHLDIIEDSGDGAIAVVND